MITSEHDKGLNVTQWARWRREILQTASYHPERFSELNNYQKQWTTDTLNTLKDLQAEEPVL